MAAAEVGPNDIIIHLVNPYKCSDCGSEFFMKNAFLEHLAEHIDKTKAQNPCYQIVCGVGLAAQQNNSITITRDILQINENQMFELQDTSMDYTQLTPLRILEQAGILNLPPPQKINVNEACKNTDECHMNVDIRSASVSSLSQSAQQHQDHSLIQTTVENNAHTHRALMKKGHNGQGSDLPSHPPNSSNLAVQQSIHSSNLESMVQQSYMMNNRMKEELNVIIEAPGGHMQEEFMGISGAGTASNQQGLRDVRTWAESDIEAIMNGKHVVLVKKVLKPDLDELRGGRAVCKICFNEFANRNVLLRHQVVHTGVKPHCCFTCFKEFNDISSLRKHLLIHKRSHRCPICLKMFLRRRQMELHLRQHNKKRYIQFGHKYHEVQVSTSRNELEQIVHEFSLSSLLNKSDKAAGNDNSDYVNNSSTTEMVDLSKADSLSTTGNDSTCKQGDTFQESATMTDHQNQGGENPSSYKKVIYKCGHCQKIINTRPTLSRHLMLHTNEKPFNCEKCGKQFRHKSDLVHHYKTHLKPLKCQTCGSAFSKQIYLNKHIEKSCPFFAEDNKKFTVLPDLTYRCNLCDKNLKSRANVFRHMRVHAFEERKFQESDVKKISKTVKDVCSLTEGGGNGTETNSTASQNAEDFIRPLTNSVGFLCTICEEEFRFKSFILIHVRMHLNLRPFKCKVCGSGFYGRYLLRKHQQNHTRPYKCPKCGKGFNRRYLMTHHFSKNHSEVSEDKMKDITLLSDRKMLRCDICGKTMNSYQKSLMQYHVRLHKDVRPHQCKVCQKSFISDIALKKHMLNHSRPYICQVCGKGFSRRYLMLEHFEKKCGSNNKDLKKCIEQTNAVTVIASSGVVFESSATGTFSEEANSNTGNVTRSDAPYVAETMTEVDEQSGVELYKCVPCDKTFTARDALLRHVKTFMKQTCCKYCKSIFSDKHLALAHQRCCLGIEIKELRNIKTVTAVSHSQKKVLKVMEEINKKIKNYASDAVSEMEAPPDHDEEANEGSDLKENSSLDTVPKRMKKKYNKYSCSECDKTFMTTRGLKIHSTCHIRLFKCETCSEDFTQIKAFRTHLKSHTAHSGGENINEIGQDEENEIGQDEENEIICRNAKRENIPALEASRKEKLITPSEENEKASCNIRKHNESSASSTPSPKEDAKAHTNTTPAKKLKVKNSSTVSADGKYNNNMEVNRTRNEMNITARLMQSGTRGRPYSCKLCRRRFTEETGLTSHISQIHGTTAT